MIGRLCFRQETKSVTQARTIANVAEREMRVKATDPPASREQRALLGLGRAAERFIAADREAREIRARRDAWSLPCERDHPDDIPCFRIGIDRVWSEENLEFLEQDPLPEN